MRKILWVIVFLNILVSEGLGQGVAAYPLGGHVGSDARAFTFGWAFSVSTRITVTGLSYLDATSHGLQEPHMVGIFSTTGGTPLVSAIVPAGAGVKFQNGFRVVPTSYVLNPGTYVVAGQSSSNADPVVLGAAAITTKPQVTYIEEREKLSSSFVYPADNFAMAGLGDFGPSFVFQEDTQTNAITGVVNSASNQPGFGPNTYVSLYGTGLSNTTRLWGSADFANGTNLPTSLDGVSVTVNGTPAYVEYVSPGQINIITPDLPVAGAGMQLIVKTPGKPDTTAWIDSAAIVPTLFTWLTGTAESGAYVVAQHADYSNVGKTGLFPGKPANFTTPARPGETIVLYGTGFGPTVPPVRSGVLTDKSYPLVPTPTATIGGINAQVVFAGLVPSLANVYQLNVVVPPTAPNGDLPLLTTTGVVTSTSGAISLTTTDSPAVSITVQK
jgi:uncharacterized protein (TIGR03437 family)